MCVIQCVMLRDDDGNDDDGNDDGKSGGCEGWLGAAIDSQDGVMCQGRCLYKIYYPPFFKFYNMHSLESKVYVHKILLLFIRKKLFMGRRGTDSSCVKQFTRNMYSVQEYSQY